MATKQTSYPGKFYFDNAAKQFEWPIEHEGKKIIVPLDELELANNNLMVKHFRGYGWHIHTAIPGTVIKSKVFNPEIKLKLPAVKIAPDDSLFHIGDAFRIASTSCELQIANVESKKVHLKYTNRMKHDLIVSQEQLTNNLAFNQWVKL